MKKANEYIEDEKRIMDLEYEFVADFVKLRKELGLSQQKLADSSNVIRETIARIENLMVSPHLNTLLKILDSVGYTIKIVPKDSNKK